MDLTLDQANSRMTAVRSEPALQGVKSQPWLVQRWPFKHLIVRDVFEKDIVDQLQSSFRVRVENHARPTASVANYDAVIMPFADCDRGAFAPLLDPEWLKLISRAMSLDATLEVDGALHSHPPGSRSGWIHNDFNPGWFGRPAKPGEVYLNSVGECDYKTGKALSPGTRPVRRMRCLTLIYYLANPQWSPGMGGETGIYLSSRQAVDRADIFVPPVDNTLLLFECTPHSWHSFLTSSFRRNSITLWLHRDFDQARQQWPHHEPVYWP